MLLSYGKKILLYYSKATRKIMKEKNSIENMLSDLLDKNYRLYILHFTLVV